MRVSSNHFQYKNRILLTDCQIFVHILFIFIAYIEIVRRDKNKITQAQEREKGNKKMNCEEYVVSQVWNLNDEVEDLQFKLENSDRLLKVANNKLDTARKIIAKFMDHSDSGNLYITSIWEWESEFDELLNALDIPITAEQAAAEAEREVLGNDNDINPYQE